MTPAPFSPSTDLPADWREGLFVGRIDCGDGPRPCVIRNGHVFDVARRAPTVADLVEGDPGAISGDDLGDLSGVDLGVGGVHDVVLLSPLDLQCVKAAGVTFAISTLERVIEENARGDAGKAAEIRQRLERDVGERLYDVVPGSTDAAALKLALIEADLWSQYLEVAIGPDAEIFTKAPVLSSVGWGSDIGVRSDSDWNNPEPEVLIVANNDGAPIGAALGNDVNLRDFEGRSALLLGKAKDNNASCAVGPFIRVFDDTFSMDDVRSTDVSLRITGADGFALEGVNAMSAISRDPLELLRQCFSEHDYPDGAALFLGSMFAPTQDRDAPGNGFTHKPGDIVEISSPRLGRLVNRVVTCPEAPPWRFGVRALMASLSQRGLLSPS